MLNLLTVLEDVIEEIALEGLDGATLPTLWIRMKRRYELKQEGCELETQLKEFIWNKILFDPRLHFYRLPENRPDIVLFDRMSPKFLDDIGHFTKENYAAFVDPYPVEPIKAAGAIMGSCATFETRVDVTDAVRDDPKMHTFEPAEELFGRNHVIVANQATRSKIFKETPGTIFYYKKKLVTYGVLVTQPCRINLPGKQQSGNLIHLRRFSRRIESPQDKAIRDAAKYLAEKPNCLEQVSVMKNELPSINGYVFKRIIRGSHKNIFEIKTIPWKEYKLNAPSSDYVTKAQGVRMARVMQLNKVAYEEYEAAQEASLNAEEAENDEDDDVKDALDGPEEHATMFSQINRIYDGSRTAFNYSTLQCGYKAIEESGAAGMTMAQMASHLAMPRRFIRNIIKTLKKENVINSHCVAIGRQQVTIYVSKVYADVVTRMNYSALQKPELLAITSGNTEDGSQTTSTDIKKSFATQRTLSRAVRIVELTKELKVIPQPYRLLKILRREEQEAGLKDMLCKHSLDRILQKLDETGYINTVVCKLNTSKGERELLMICASDVGGDHELVQGCIQMWQLNEKTKSINTFRSRESTALTEEPSLKPFPTPNPAMAKKYGYKPKFKRAKIMYEFLHYLLYSYDGSVPAEGSLMCLDTVVSYQDEVSWKIFIPPLAGERSPGWCILGDAWLLCPLSLFVQLSSVMFEVPGIEEYLGDPIKQHYLLRFLPDEMRSLLLFNRRWLYQLHEQATTLSHMGLGRFGPQKHKEKDQVWFYLNRNITIIDTSGRSGFLKTGIGEKDFLLESYSLQTEDDIFAFWTRVEDICMSTPLGMYSKLAAETYVAYASCQKPELVEAARRYDFDSVTSEEGGLPPGDHQGACGFDSGLYAHRRANWSAVRQSHRKLKESLETVSGLKVIEQRFRTKMKRNDKLKGSSAASTALAVPKVMPLPKEPVVRRRKEFIIRNKRVYKREGRKAVELDERDVEALKNMKNLKRVKWLPEHDYILLLVKTLSSVVYPDHGRLVVPASQLRDLLLSLFPESCHDKTKQATVRRLRQLLKYPEKNAVARAMRFNIKREPRIMKQVEEIQDSQNAQSKHKLFLDLIDIARNSLSRQGVKCSSDVNLNNLSSFEVDELQGSRSTFRYREPLNIVDVHQATVATILISSFALDGKTNWSYLLYTIYERYPDPLLCVVLKGQTDSQMIARKKSKNYKVCDRVLHLPALPYSLSFKWYFMMKLRYHDEVVNVMSQQMQRISHERSVDIADNNPTPSMMILFAHLALYNHADVSYEFSGSPIEFVFRKSSGKLNPKTAQSSSRSSVLAARERMMDYIDNIRYDEEMRLNPLPIKCVLKDDTDLRMGCYSHKVKGGDILKNDVHTEIIRRLKLYYDHLPSESEAELVIQKEFQPSRKYSATDAEFAMKTYRLVLASKEVGLSLHQLWIIQSGKLSYLEQILAALCQLKTLLQIGVNHKRYVTFSNSNPWLIKSYRIPKEMRKRVSDAMDDMVPRKRIRRSSRSNEAGEAVVEPEALTADPSKKAPGGEREINHRQRRRQMKCISAQLENCKPLLFVPKMWKRPDGSLNVNIFTKMLLAVFSFICDHPGITEEDLQEKFCSVIEPSIQVIDLVDILLRLGCIRRLFLLMGPPETVDLFSRPVIGKGISDDSESTDDVKFYEPTEDAMLKMNLFFTTSLQQRTDLPG